MSSLSGEKSWENITVTCLSLEWKEIKLCLINVCFLSVQNYKEKGG